MKAKFIIRLLLAVSLMVVVWMMVVRPASRQWRLTKTLRQVAAFAETPDDAFVYRLAAEGPKAVPTLIEALDHDNINVRLVSIRALGDILAECEMLSGMMNCVTGIVIGKSEAIAAMDKIVPEIARRLESEETEIRIAALEALLRPFGLMWLQRRAELQQIEASLERLRNDDDAEVRLGAVLVTRAVCAERSVVALLQATSDADDSVGDAACLGIIWVVLVEDVPDNLTYDERIGAIAAIASMVDYEPSEHGFHPACDARHDREACFFALNEFGRSNAISVLNELMEDTNTDIDVRLSAATCLFFMGHKQPAVEELIAMVRDTTDGHDQAARLLARPEMRNGDITRRALDALKNEDREAWEAIDKCK